jgi:hypothetical protein
MHISSFCSTELASKDPSTQNSAQSKGAKDSLVEEAALLLHGNRNGHWNRSFIRRWNRSNNRRGWIGWGSGENVDNGEE